MHRAAAWILATAALLSPAAPALAAADVKDGRALLQKGDYEKAARVFADLVKANPKDPEARRGACEALLGLGQTAKARDHALAGLDATADKDGGLWLLLARTYLLDAERALAAREDATEALGDARAKASQALRADPACPGARAVLGKSFRLLGQFDEALATLQEAVKKEPKDFDAWFEIGAASLQKPSKDPVVALEAYGKAAALDPKSSASQVGRALALGWLGRWDEAFDAHVAAAVADPRDRTPLDYLDKQAKAKAPDHYRRIVKARPDHAWAHAYLGRALALAKDAEGAAGEMKEVRRLAPKEAALLAWDGDVQSLLGKQDAAVAAWRAALEADPSLDAAWGKLSGRAFDPRSGAPANERESLLEVLKKARPKDAFLWNDIGLYYRDTQRYREALKAYLTASELAPEDQDILNDTAIIYQFYGKAIGEDPRKALPMFEKVLALGAEDEKKARGYHDTLENLAVYYGPPAPAAHEQDPAKALDYATRRLELGPNPKVGMIKAWAEGQLKKP